MNNLVNLNKFRKRKAKLEKERKAEQNRRLHGRTQAERQQEAAQKRTLETQVDGSRLVEAPAEHADERGEPK